MIEIRQGDCLELIKELPDESVDFVFTDPPYGHNNQDGDLANVIHSFPGALARKSDDVPRPIHNDGEEATPLLEAVLPEIRRVLKPGGCCCCCCCGGGGPDPQFARWSLILDKHIGFKMMVVWDKGPMGMGWHYRRSYETVLVAMKPGGPCKWYDETNAVENVIRGIRKIIPTKEDHPAPKPVELARHFISLHTLPGDVVLDPFAGGGSTLLAAKELNRKAIGFELAPEYVAMAEKRLESVTPSMFCE